MTTAAACFLAAHHDPVARLLSKMNTRPIIDESSGPIALSAAFNNDASCFAVGLDSGFCGMRVARRV